MLYKAVGFDYGGVVRGQPIPAYQKEIEDILDVTREEYLTAYYRYNKLANRDEVTWPELWGMVLRDLDKSDKIDQVMKVVNDMFAQPLNKRILELVNRIHSSGIKTGLLSNNASALRPEIEKEGIGKYFDVMQISAETGFVKPEKEAFVYFAKVLGVNMHELIFIDDSNNSLSTAKQCGYTPILYENFPALLDKLKKLGVLGQS